MVAVQITRVLPSSIRHEPSAVEMKTGTMFNGRIVRRNDIGAIDHTGGSTSSSVSHQPSAVRLSPFALRSSLFPVLSERHRLPCSWLLASLL